MDHSIGKQTLHNWKDVVKGFSGHSLAQIGNMFGQGDQLFAVGRFR
jgi:hypothetical protein